MRRFGESRFGPPFRVEGTKLKLVLALAWLVRLCSAFRAQHLDRNLFHTPTVRRIGKKNWQVAPVSTPMAHDHRRLPTLFTREKLPQICRESPSSAHKKLEIEQRKSAQSIGQRSPTQGKALELFAERNTRLSPVLRAFQHAAISLIHWKQGLHLQKSGGGGSEPSCGAAKNTPAQRIKTDRLAGRSTITFMKTPEKSPRSSALVGATLVGVAIGATAVGALAAGAVAVGALAIGRLAVRKGQIDELTIGDLKVRNLTVENSSSERSG